MPSRTFRAIASSDLKTPSGGSFDWVVICIMKPSGRAASAPRTSTKMSLAFGFLAKTWVSSTRIPVDFEPVMTSVSAALILRVAPEFRWVMVRMCRWAWNSFRRDGSALMVPCACRKAMSAISLVGAINRNSASGRRFMIIATTMIAAA